eukprot:457817-Pyramimonas_sp.AAC.1
MLERSGRRLGCLGAPLGAPEGLQGPTGPSWAFRGPSWAVFGLSWGRRGLFGGGLGGVWRRGARWGSPPL